MASDRRVLWATAIYHLTNDASVSVVAGEITVLREALRFDYVGVGLLTAVALVVTIACQLVFGAGVGLLTWIIRTWGGYPEGMAFAVLLMNALAPVIDRFCKPRILGRQRNGKELEPARETR